MSEAFLFGVSFVLAVYYGLYLTLEPPSARKLVVKTLSVMTLCFVAVLSDAPFLLIAALAFGAVGDGFLAMAGSRSFIAGLSAFLLGHMCLIALFWMHGSARFDYGSWRLFVALALITTGILVYVKLMDHLGALKRPVTAYILIITSMGISALTLPVLWPLGLAIVGAILFILSDMILSAELFIMTTGSPHFIWSSRLVWAFYWSAQTLITLGFVLPSAT